MTVFPGPDSNVKQVRVCISKTESKEVGILNRNDCN